MAAEIRSKGANAVGKAEHGRPRRTLPLLTSLFLILALVGGAAASVWLFYRYRPVPASLTEPAESSVTALVAEKLPDTRDLELTIQVGDGATIASPVAGKVTSSSCSPGAEIASGTTTFTVDKTPLANLHTNTPLWRNLKAEDKGDDVKALQAELVRLGKKVKQTGKFDHQTWRAWDDLVEDLGGDTETDQLALAQLVWLPTTSIRPDSCPARLGATVAEGGDLITLPKPLLRASISSLPDDLVPGARSLVIGETVVATDETGNVTAEGLAALAATPQFIQYQRGPEGEKVKGRYSLTEPLDVYPVPPAAITLRDGSRGCVAAADGTAIPVTVVASKLGRTYIRFETTPATREVRSRAPEGLSCS